jgi:arginyl-tRNA synthetase
VALNEAALRDARLDRLTDESELALVRRLAAYPRVLQSAASAHEPHRVAFYLYDLASEFHALWNKGKELPQLRFILSDDMDATRARLALLKSVANVISGGLAILGVAAPTEMR